MVRRLVNLLTFHPLAILAVLFVLCPEGGNNCYLG
jgi:hypothetical protein